MRDMVPDARGPINSSASYTLSPPVIPTVSYSISQLRRGCIKEPHLVAARVSQLEFQVLLPYAAELR